MTETKIFPLIAPEGLIPIAFDFSEFLGTASIASVKSVSITTWRGTDLTPADRLYNTAQIDGQRVVQWIRYPVLGVTYKIQAIIIANDGREWPCTALLPVREA